MRLSDFEVLDSEGQGYQDVFSRRIGVSGITTFRFPNGVFIIEQDFIPYLDKYGDIVAILSGYTDITEKIAKDKEIQERKQDLRSAVAQITENMTTFSALNDQIRNPLTVLAILTEELDPESQKNFNACIYQIDEIVDLMDKGWLDSEKVRNYLKKHNNID